MDLLAKVWTTGQLWALNKYKAFAKQRVSLCLSLGVISRTQIPRFSLGAFFCIVPFRAENRSFHPQSTRKRKLNWKIVLGCVRKVPLISR